MSEITDQTGEEVTLYVGIVIISTVDGKDLLLTPKWDFVKRITLTRKTDSVI